MVTNLPVNGKFTITCAYGERGTLWKSGVHNGIDFIGSDDIYSTCDGTVSFVGFDEKGWGRYVSVKPDNYPNERHIFAHLVKNSVKVKVGDKVSRKTVLGTMGATGNVTGKHLHFEIRRDNKAIDPTPYLGIPNKRGTYNANDYPVVENSPRYNFTVKNITGADKVALEAQMKAKGYVCEVNEI